MQYETIILELMTRIKTLEEKTAYLDEKIQTLEAAAFSISSDDAISDTAEDASASVRTLDTQKTVPYQKMNDAMIDICYTLGKKAYQVPDTSISDYAELAGEATGMNQNSAVMYIYAVKSMLAGKAFKRAISTKALRKYFSVIDDEFGKSGLAKAITAVRGHVEYRLSHGISADSIAALCDEFQSRI